MPEPETESQPGVLSEQDQRSISILNKLQWTSHYALVGDQIVTYDRVASELLPGRKIPVEDFLIAVDFYTKNRMDEALVCSAMTTPDGVVRVYAPTTENPRFLDNLKVVAKIRNLEIPRMLETAYLVARQAGKEK